MTRVLIVDGRSTGRRLLAELVRHSDASLGVTTDSFRPLNGTCSCSAARPEEHACALPGEGRGHRFDPGCVDAFLAARDDPLVNRHQRVDCSPVPD